MQREEGSDGVDGPRDEIDGAKMIVDSVVTYTMLGMIWKYALKIAITSLETL